MKRLVIVLLTALFASVAFGLMEFTGPLVDIADVWISDRLVSTSTNSDGNVQLDTLDDLTEFITGTTSQVIVTDDGDGTITLSTPQDIATSSSPTFRDLTLTYPSNIYDLNHDSFAGFVANEHINHSSVTLTAGDGLTGGGDITTSRSFAVDMLGLEDLTDPGADRVYFWDDSAGLSTWLTVGTTLGITTTTLDLDTTLKTNYDAAYTHVSNNGSDHSYIDQDVTSTAIPTFEGLALDDTGDLRFSTDVGIGGISWLSWRDALESGSAYHNFYRANGGSDAGKTTVVNGDWGFKTRAYGYDGAGYDLYGGTLYDFYDVASNYGKFVIWYDVAGAVKYGFESGEEQTRIGDTEGGHYIQVASATGRVTLVGNARAKKTYQIQAVDLHDGATAPADTTIGNYAAKLYTINDDSIAQFMIPKDWDSSTALSVVIHWYCDEAYAADSGEVQWRIRWSATPSGATEAIDGPTHTGTIDYGDQDIPATAKHLTESAGGAIAAASLAAGDIVGMTIDRVALDGGNNPTAEPGIVHIEIEYTANAFGEAI